MIDKKTVVKPYQTGEGKKKQVTAMFDKIAHKYDFLNHFLSLGIDRFWRKRTIGYLSETNPQYVLDVATGTGDLAFEAVKKITELRVEGVDISKEMLEIGRRKAAKYGLTDRVHFVLGDSENLPMKSEIFDAVMVAFGVRNFEDLQKGLHEMYRVLKPGASIFILEFSRPIGFPFKQLFNLYFKFILPLIGRITSKDQKAYKYLFESVQSFPDYEEFIDFMKNAGFHSNKWHSLSLGICSIYIGQK